MPWSLVTYAESGWSLLANAFTEVATEANRRKTILTEGRGLRGEQTPKTTQTTGGFILPATVVRTMTEGPNVNGEV